MSAVESAALSDAGPRGLSPVVLTAYVVANLCAWTAILTRLDRVDQRFDGVEQRFDAVDGRFDGIEGRFTTLEQGQAMILDLLRRGNGEGPPASAE